MSLKASELKQRTVSGVVEVFEPCGRCAGYGYIAGYEYVENGVCFGCQGRAGEWVSAEDYERRRKQRERYHARKAKADAEKAAKELAKLEAFKTANPGLLDALEDLGAFGESLKQQVYRKKQLSDKQIAAAWKAIEQRKADKADAVDVPEGREVVTGKIIKIKHITRHYRGRVTEQTRMTVKDDRGFIINSTAPKAIVDDIEHGARVEFTATLEASIDDKTFGFGSRPAKAKML